MLTGTFGASPRPAAPLDLRRSAAIGAEKMTRMPPGKAERGGEERGFVFGKRADCFERRTRIGMRLLNGGETRLAILDAEEQIRGRGCLPFEPPARSDCGKAITPD